MKFTRFAILVLTFSGLSGCAIIGPSTVPRDRFDYINAISESWKSQTLLNLVKNGYGDAPVAPLVRILSSPQPPEDGFAVVPYRQEWYWIDDKDFRSKSLFSFIMFLFTLTETEGKQGAPLITIPAG